MILTLATAYLFTAASTCVVPGDTLCNSVPFRNKSVFCGVGVILKNDNNIYNLRAKFYLKISINDAKKYDSIMISKIKYGIYRKNLLFYKKYDRQYIGFCDSIGNKYVFINLIEHKKAKHFIGKLYDKYLYCDPIFVFVEPGREFLERYRINVVTNLVELY